MEMGMFAWRDWLYALRLDGKPRVLRLPSFPDTKNLIELIKKVYLNEHS
jgi:hypothetical protein